jgi:hypothetical protein
MDRRQHHPKSFKVPHIHTMKWNQALVTRGQKQAAKTNCLNFCITVTFLLSSQTVQGPFMGRMMWSLATQQYLCWAGLAGHCSRLAGRLKLKTTLSTLTRAICLYVMADVVDLPCSPRSTTLHLGTSKSTRGMSSCQRLYLGRACQGTLPIVSSCAPLYHTGQVISAPWP